MMKGARGFMRICVLADETIEEFGASMHLSKYAWDLLTVRSPVFEFIRDASLSRQYDGFSDRIFRAAILR